VGLAAGDGRAPSRVQPHRAGGTDRGAARAGPAGLGATDAIDPADGDVAAAIRALLPDGVDFALESSGRVGVMETALASLAAGAR
jgi:Zn-dependent alcohol dehydrogenase